MKALRIAKYAIPALVVIAIALFLHYNLPRTAVVQIVGTDVKRADTITTDEVVTRDVRYITSKDRDGDPRVFRNEDTGWGWPPYFKFDSANLTSQSQAYAGETDRPWVLITYYGWRSTIFSMFPNAISIEQVDEDYSHLPLFNIIFLIFLASGVGALVFGARKWRAARRARRELTIP